MLTCRALFYLRCAALVAGLCGGSLCAEPTTRDTADQANDSQNTASSEVHWSVDVLFRFGQSGLDLEARQILDMLVVQLRTLHLERVVLAGHADRWGNRASNQKIAQLRAQVVRDYLLAQGIPGQRVAAVGRGQLLPVTRSGQCLISPVLAEGADVHGLARAAALAPFIACLQPDRRVEIDVFAMRRHGR